jgi:hypothetical protein
MKKTNTLLFTISLLISVTFLFSSCEKADKPTPTNQLMDGVWKVTEVRDANDSNVTAKVSPLLVPNIIQLNSTNGVNSTAGPLFMYIVYGNSKFMNVVSQLDQAFKYADSNFGLTEGEWGIKKEEVTDHFTIEMKMKFPTIQTLQTILNAMGVSLPAFVESVIYHKFMNVKVSISDENKEEMIWTFDNETVPEYNIKDENLHYALWTGISTNSFSRCTIKLTKQVRTIQDMVSESYAPAKIEFQ